LTPFGKVVVALIAATGVLGLVRWGLAGTDATPGAGDRSATTAAAPSVRSPASPLPDCIYGDIPTDHAGYDQWDRTVLDTEFRIPRTYVPPDLASVELAGFRGAFRVRSFVLPDLEKLRTAAASAGHPLDIVATYRSYRDQAELFQSRKEQFGYDRSLDKTAREGHSEHQLGTAIDFKTAGTRDVTEAWGREPTGRWMARNAHRYGFVLSYPEDARDKSCYPYEPWHFRYVGRGLASEVHASGMTLREYLWRLNHS
jgi:D-alanyl-D-alanine carboxypeptidase